MTEATWLGRTLCKWCWNGIHKACTGCTCLCADVKAEQTKTLWQDFELACYDGGIELDIILADHNYRPVDEVQ